MGVETNGAPPSQNPCVAESPDNFQAVVMSSSAMMIPTEGAVGTGTNTTAGDAGTTASPTVLASLDDHGSSLLPVGPHQEEDVLPIALKTELSNIRGESRDVFLDRITSQFSTETPTTSATNRKYNTSSSPPPPSAPPTKHFRFSGDFTLFRNTSVLSAFASSMGNLSNALNGGEEARTYSSELIATSRAHIAQFSNASPKSPESSSILTELPTRFSFESSSTTSSSSSHRKIYQRNHGGSFDRKDELSNLSTQCGDFESFISTQINRYGSVEKLMGYAGHPGRPREESSKGAATDLSSLSLSPINRRREVCPSISL